MNTLIMLIAISMTGVMAGRLEAGCLHKPNSSSEKVLRFFPHIRAVGCIVAPRPAIAWKTSSSSFFAEEQDGGYCLYSKLRNPRVYKQPRIRGERKGKDLSHRVAGMQVFYRLTSMGVVEMDRNKGYRVTDKSVAIDDVAAALQQEFADSSEAHYASGVASYVLSGNAAITRTTGRLCHPGKYDRRLGRCRIFQPDPTSAVLGKVIEAIIQTAGASEDSTSCAKQSQI